MPLATFLKEKREDLIKAYFDYIKELLENDMLDKTISYKKFTKKMHKMDQDDQKEDDMTMFDFLTSENELESDLPDEYREENFQLEDDEEQVS